jgi:hypothetical protein
MIPAWLAVSHTPTTSTGPWSENVRHSGFDLRAQKGPAPERVKITTVNTTEIAA